LILKEKKSEFIHRLVHSLTKAEMEYFFRISYMRENRTGNPESPLYVDLFRAILSQETYNETQLRASFPVPNFSELKGRLIKAIFKGIHIYGNLPQKGRNWECTEIAFLLQKRFFAEARSRIKRSKKKALKEEAFLTMLTLLDLENELFIQDSQAKYDEAYIDCLDRERKEAVDRYQQFQELMRLYNRVHGKIKKQFTPSGKLERKYVEEIENHHLLSGEQKVLSRRSELVLLRLEYIVSYLSGKLPQSAGLLDKIVKTYEDHPFLIAGSEPEFWQRKYQLATMYFHHGDYESGKQHLQFFHAQRHKEPIHFVYYFTASLDLRLHTDDFSGADQFIADLQRGYKKFQDFLSLGQKYTLWLALAQLEFYRSNIQQSVRYIRSIIDQPIRNQRIDIQGAARIIMILLHYESNDLDGMEYYIRMATHFLNRRRAIFPFERAFFNFFRLAVRETDPSKRLEALTKLQGNISQSLEEDSSIRAFHFFDYQGWIERTIAQLEAEAP